MNQYVIISNDVMIWLICLNLSYQLICKMNMTYRLVILLDQIVHYNSSLNTWSRISGLLPTTVVLRLWYGKTPASICTKLHWSFMALETYHYTQEVVQIYLKRCMRLELVHYIYWVIYHRKYNSDIYYLKFYLRYHNVLIIVCVWHNIT